MSDSSGNGVARFRVIYPDPVLQAVRNFGESLSSEDDRRRFAAALRVIHARLRNDPLAFGEHRFTLPESRNTVRIAGKTPLLVRFAVNPDKRYVYIYQIYTPTR